MTLWYALVGMLFSAYSWGFVDPNMPFTRIAPLITLVFDQKQVSTVLYIGFLVVLWVLYAQMLRLAQNKKLTEKKFWITLIVTIVCFFFAFSALSNDVFNYIATAKMTYLYHENPYLVMPIEIPNEPMLRFLHASNKVALYGPVWIILTFVPHMLGAGSLLLTFFAFKAWIVTWFVIFLFGLKRLAKNMLYPLVFVAFNPLVMVETVTSAHNDVVMMAFAVWAFYFLRQKRMLVSGMLLIFSILVKYATVLLVPVWIYGFIHHAKGNTVSEEKIYRMAFWSMMLIFFLSPLREEIYPWYFIWPLTFAALLPMKSMETYISYGFSFGLPFRYAPYILTREWGGITPMVKKIVTFAPPLLTSAFYVKQRKY